MAFDATKRLPQWISAAFSRKIPLMGCAIFLYILTFGLHRFNQPSDFSWYNFGRYSGLWSDALTGWSMPALNLIDGIGFAKGDFLSAPGPTMSLYVSIFYFIFGYAPWAVYIGNIILLSIYVLLLYGLSLKIFNSFSVAFGSVLPLLIYPSFLPWEYALNVMTEIPVMFFALVFFLTCSFSNAGRMYLLAGLSVGFLIGVKSIGIILAPCAITYIVLSQGLSKSSVRNTLIFLVGVSIFVLPIVIRSMVLFGDFNILATLNMLGAVESNYLTAVGMKERLAQEEELFARWVYQYFVSGEAALRNSLALELQTAVMDNVIQILHRFSLYVVYAFNISRWWFPVFVCLVFVLFLTNRKVAKAARMDFLKFLFVLGGGFLYMLATAFHPVYLPRYNLPFKYLELVLVVGCVLTVIKQGALLLGTTAYVRPVSGGFEERSLFYPLVTFFVVMFIVGGYLLSLSVYNCHIKSGGLFADSIVSNENLPGYYPGTLAGFYRDVGESQGDVSAFKMKRMRWTGMIETIVFVPANSDMGGRMTAVLPYDRMLAHLRVDASSCSGAERIWLDIPVGQGDERLYQPNMRLRGVVEGVIDPYEKSILYERYRIRATKVKALN